MGKKLDIAVVGGGIAGISAANQLQDEHRVTLFEANEYVGGHTNTLTIPDGPDAGTPVDTGFIVLNDRTYPVLNSFLEDLDVEIRKSDMSFSYFSERTGFQYASRNINSLFAQRKNIFNPLHWKMLGEILASTGVWKKGFAKTSCMVSLSVNSCSVTSTRVDFSATMSIPWWRRSGRPRMPG